MEEQRLTPPRRAAMSLKPTSCRPRPPHCASLKKMKNQIGFSSFLFSAVKRISYGRAYRYKIIFIVFIIYKQGHFLRCLGETINLLKRLKTPNFMGIFLI